MAEDEYKFKRVDFNNLDSIVNYGKELYDDLATKTCKKNLSLEELIQIMLEFTNELELAYNIGVIDKQDYLVNNSANSSTLDKKSLVDLFEYKLKFIFNNISVWRSFLVSQEIEPFRKRIILEILLESVGADIQKKSSISILKKVKQIKSRTKK